MSDGPLSRRRFLVSASASAALAAGAQFLFAADAPASKPASRRTDATTRRRGEPKPLPAATTKTRYSALNVACIGIGGRGHDDLAEIIKTGANVIAICDIDTNTLNRTASELPNAHTYTDFRELLTKEEKNLDAVVVATPDHCHAPAAMMAMRMHKHAYCEKPLTYDIHEARTLTHAARKYELKTQMGNQGAAVEGSRRQVEYIKSGIVGNIKEVHVYTDRPVGYWPQGLIAPTDRPPVPDNIKWDLWLGPAPYRPYHPDYMPFKWRGWWDFGTGALGDMACHIMNTAHWALDLSNPAVVTSFSDGKTVDSPPRWQIIKWEFPEHNGRPAVKMFWYDGKMLPPPTLMGDKKFPGDHNGVVFVGENGNIGAPYLGDPFLVNDQQQKDLKPPEKTLPRSIGHHKEWLEAILGGPTPASNFDHSGPLTETVLLGNLASRTGRRIEWDRKAMKVTNNSDAQKYVQREYRKGWTL